MFNYNPCKRDLNVQAEAITKSISIGQLTGLRSTKKSQILKIQLGKGLNFIVVEEIPAKPRIIDLNPEKGEAKGFSENKKLNVQNVGEIPVFVKNYQNRFVSKTNKESLRPHADEHEHKFEKEGNGSGEKSPISTGNTDSEIKISPGETKTVFEYSLLDAGLLENTLAGYEQFVTFVECSTRLDISIGVSWDSNENLLETEVSDNILGGGVRSYPECWVRVRLMTASKLFDKILENYHLLSNLMR